MKYSFLIIISFLLLTPVAQAERLYSGIIHDLVKQKAIIDAHVAVVNKSTETGNPLTGLELFEIGHATMERLKVTTEAFAFLENLRPLLISKRWKDRNKIPFTNGELAETTQGLSVASTLFDLMLYTYAVSRESKRLRRLLNEEDPSYEREEDTLTKNSYRIFTYKNKVHLKRAFILYKDFCLVSPALIQNKNLEFAHKVIQSSYYYNDLMDKNNFYFAKEVLPVIKVRLNLVFMQQADTIDAFSDRIIFGLSMGFGNLAGSFQNRHGRLHKDQAFMAMVTKKLKSLDILLEKTPFRLTDRFIPGYWGHAAIYIGSVSELKSLGLWNHPLVERFKSKMNNGHLIVEALRSKVQLNSLESFSDIDDFALLRLKMPLSLKEKRSHILRALSQVGKRYDFNFDVETGKTIVCSELHYRTFINIPFATTRILSRSTISVDQVAEVALSGGLLVPLMLYIDGKLMPEHLIQSEYDQKLIPPQMHPADL